MTPTDWARQREFSGALALPNGALLSKIDPDLPESSETAAHPTGLHLANQGCLRKGLSEGESVVRSEGQMGVYYGSSSYLSIEGSVRQTRDTIGKG